TGAPLTAQQSMPDGRDQMLDQPCLDRPRVGIAVGVERRQVRPRSRHLFVQVVIVNQVGVELGIVLLQPFRLLLRLRLRREIRLLQRLCLPAGAPALAVEQRQYGRSELAGTADDFTGEPTFSEITTAKTVGELC